MRTYSIVVAVCVCLSFAQSVFAQASEDVLDDFRIAKSIGVGLSGVVTSTQLSVEDEFGVAYDTVSLLQQPGVKEMVGVSEEDFAVMSQTKADLVAEIESMVVSAVYSDEYRDRVRARFFEVENEMRDNLNENQLTLLKMARAKVGFESNGPKYLSVPTVAKSLGLSENSAKQFGKSVGFMKLIKEEKQELLNAANKELIAQLDESEKKLFERVIAGKSLKNFLATPLFVDAKGKRRKSADLQEKRFSVLKRNYIQRKLELDADQLAKLNAVDDSDEKTALEFLNDDQLKEVDRLAIVPEFKKVGTVLSLSGGLLSQRLELDEERCKELREFGESLREKLANELASSTIELLVEKFDLTSQKATEISRLMMP